MRFFEWHFKEIERKEKVQNRSENGICTSNVEVREETGAKHNSGFELGGW